MELNDTMRFTIDLDKDLHTNLKIMCVGNKKSMKEVVQEAIRKEIELMQRRLHRDV